MPHLRSIVLRSCLLVVLLCVAGTSFGQSTLPKTANDSLWAIWNDTRQADTNRLKAMHDIAREGYLFSQPDSAFFYAQLELDYARKAGLKSNMAGALNTQGASFYLKGDYDKAMGLYQASLKMSVEAKDSKAKATAYSNIGLVNRRKGEDAIALEYYEKALRLQEEIRDEKGIALTYNNIAAIHFDLGDISRALDYHDKSLRLREKIGDRIGVAYSYGNIGNIHVSNGDRQRALKYFQKGLAIGEELGDKDFVANVNTNIANIYQSQSDYAKALEHHNRGLKIYQEMGNRREIAAIYVSIGAIYYGMKNHPLATEYCQKGLEEAELIGDNRVIADACNNLAVLTFSSDSTTGAKGSLVFALRSMEAAKQLKFPEKIQNAAETLTLIYRKQGRYKEALEMHILQMVMRDSIVNEENKREVIRQQMQYDYDQKEALTALEQEKKDAIATEQLRRREIYLAAAAAITFLLGIMSLMAFFAYRAKVKVNVLLEKKNHLIHEQKKEITDSIEYAENIQRALLPHSDVLQAIFPDSFILFRPKDIVSGDFYWIHDLPDRVYFAVVDCTGHGVPGAFMSFIGTSALKRAVTDLGLVLPSDILLSLSDQVSEMLRSGKGIDVKDGMDLSLCCYFKERRELHFAGAYNPLWILRKGEMEVIRADKHPIGNMSNHRPFTDHVIQIAKGDAVYLFSDGFADQFGGANDKKIGSGKFRSTLTETADRSLMDQGMALASFFDEWKGKTEQIDDVCVMGVRF